MAGLDHIPKLSALLVIVLCSFRLPAGLAYPTDDIFDGNGDTLAFPLSDGVEFRHDDKPKGCFHFYVSRNMSSLLSEATKMLQQVRDRHEREWILTFIYRIKALAEHLRTHPESRNYQCLPGEDEEGRRRNSIQTDHSKNPQQELYFVDDNWPNSLQKRSKTDSDQSEETNPKTTDNQNSPPLSPGAQQEEHKPEEESKSSKEQDSKAASEELSSAESEPKAKDAPGKPEDSILANASAKQPELNQHQQQQEKRKDHPESGSISQNSEKATAQTSDKSSSHVEAPEEFISGTSMDCEKVRACARALRQHIEELNARITKAPKKRQSPPPPSPEEEEELSPMYNYIPTEKQVEEERNHQLMLKRRIRKALMEELAPEIKKLRTVDGTQDDLIKLWNQSDPNAPATPAKKDKREEFDYEEIGAAAGDLSSSDPYTTNDHTVAPSDGDMKKRQSGDESTTQEFDPYEDGDELVRQLFEIRVQYVATKSINGDEEDGLVTSTFVPF